ncbi:MAG: hypothetical protein PHN72_06340 [Bacilli bacterium]|nr:hypothetical protein [Bacilli bacterium]
MKKNNKVIPIKNYIILAIVVVLTLLLCGYLRNWYKMKEEATLPEGIMSGFMPEVKLEELDNYLLENPNIFLYVSSSSEENNRQFEKKFHDYIKKNNHLGFFVYLDTKGLSLEEVSTTLKSKSSIKKDNINYTLTPNLYAIKEGKIDATLYTTKVTYHYKDLIHFILKQGLAE